VKRRSSLAWLGVGDFSANCCTVCGHRCINGVICAKCGGDPMAAGDLACIFCERALNRELFIGVR